MTTTVSTVPAAIAALTSLITAQVATDSLPILVCQGEPPMDMPSDIIQIATDVMRTVVPQVFLGGYAQGSLEERYTITCLPGTLDADARGEVLLRQAEQRPS